MDQLVTMSKVLQETQRVVDGIEPAQLDNPTPCDDWTVRDVLNHITGGARMYAIAAAEGSVPDEQLGEIMGGDNLGTDYKAAFRAASDRALDAYSPPGVLDKMVVLPFGEMPAGAALDLAIFDVTTHTWDLARGTGQRMELDAEVLDTALGIAQQMVADDWRAAGVFGAEVTVAADAPPEDRLAAFTGRTP
jgi:uncharacterized protein (TIGR03086 family)